MDPELANKICNYIVRYKNVRINGSEEFKRPFQIQKIYEYITEHGFHRASTDGTTYLYPGGDLEKIIEGYKREQYREKKLSVLSDIRRELIRANDKQELRSFVDGMVSEKKSALKSLE